MKMKKINFILAIMIVALGFSSCEKSIPERKASPVVKAGNQNVYFLTENNKEYKFEDKDKIEVKVQRNASTAGQALEIPLKVVVNESDVFVVPEKISFAKDETIAVLDITFPNIKIGVKYNLVIEIEDPSGLLVDPYSNEATRYKQHFKTSEVKLEYFKEIDTYRFKDCYFEGYHIMFKVDKDGLISLVPEKQETGYVHKKYGMVNVNIPAEKTTEAKFDKDSKTYTLPLDFTVSAGTFGVKTETFVAQ